MKQPLIVFALAILASCGDRENKSPYDTQALTITQDTVLVDPGDELIYLRTGLFHSALSADGRYLYNFNAQQYLLEKIDLEELRLVSMQPFEKEGPNGVGSNMYRVFLAGEDDLLLISFGTGGGVFDLEGNLKKRLPMKGDELEGDEMDINERVFSAALSPSGKLFGTYMNFMEETFYMGVIDTEAKTFKRVELPEQAYQKEYFFSMVSDKGQPMMMVGPNYYLNYANDRVYVSNSLDNSIYVYHPGTEELQRVGMDHQLIPHRKTGKYAKTIEDRERFMEQMRAFNAEVTFQAPVWDATNEWFYRLAYTTEVKQDAEGKDIEKANVFLSVFDADLNLLHESKLDNYNKRPAYHFVKDGQIWLFENVEDELGFIRLAVQ